MENRFYSAEKALRTAINRIVRKEPFWAKLLSCLKIDVVKEKEIVAKGVNILIGEEIIQLNTSENGTKLDTSLLEGTVLAMVLRIALLHQQRQQKRLKTVWDAACNLHIINLLNQMKYPIPSDVKEFYDNINIEDILEEKIYDKLIEKMNSEQENNSNNSEENQETNNNNKSKNNKNDNQNEETNNNSSPKKNKLEQENNSNNSKKNQGTNNSNKGKNNKDDNQNEETNNNSSPKKNDNKGKTTKQNDNFNNLLKMLNEKMGTVKPSESAEKNNDKIKTDKENREIELMIHQILIAGQKAGDLPSFYKEQIKSLRKTNFSLHKILEEFVVNSIEPSRYNWQRGNRIYLANQIFYPTLHCENVGGVLVAFDTSGSCYKQITKILGIILEINELYCGSGEPINLLYCDTKLHYQVWHNKNKLPEPIGGGGTSYAPVMDWVKQKVTQNPDQFTTLLYLTDGECSNYGVNPGIPVTWLILNIYDLKPEQIEKIPFGRKVVVSKEQLAAYN